MSELAVHLAVDELKDGDDVYALCRPPMQLTHDLLVSVTYLRENVTCKRCLAKLAKEMGDVS